MRLLILLRWTFVFESGIDCTVSCAVPPGLILIASYLGVDGFSSLSNDNCFAFSVSTLNWFFWQVCKCPRRGCSVCCFPALHFDNNLPSLESAYQMVACEVMSESLLASFNSTHYGMKVEPWCRFEVTGNILLRSCSLCLTYNLYILNYFLEPIADDADNLKTLVASSHNLWFPFTRW